MHLKLSKSKAQHIAFKVVVTFIESALAYWATTGNLVSKTALAGAVGAGLSACYNLGRHYFDV